MTPRNPPAIATWILEHAIVGPSGHALAGDLIECHAQGRGRRWYWSQVLSAVAVNVLQQIRTHTLLTLRAFGMTWIGYRLWAALVLAMTNLVVPPMIQFWGYVTTEPWVLAFRYVMVLVGCFGCVAVGWTVGRLHRRAHLGGVLAFVATALLLSWSVWTRLGYAALNRPALLPVSLLGSMRAVLWTASLLAGALLSVETLSSATGTAMREAQDAQKDTMRTEIPQQ